MTLGTFTLRSHLTLFCIVESHAVTYFIAIYRYAMQRVRCQINSAKYLQPVSSLSTKYCYCYYYTCTTAVAIIVVAMAAAAVAAATAAAVAQLPISRSLKIPPVPSCYSYTGRVPKSTIFPQQINLNSRDCTTWVRDSSG